MCYFWMIRVLKAIVQVIFFTELVLFLCCFYFVCFVCAVVYVGIFFYCLELQNPEPCFFCCFLFLFGFFGSLFYVGIRLLLMMYWGKGCDLYSVRSRGVQRSRGGTY